METTTTRITKSFVKKIALEYGIDADYVNDSMGGYTTYLTNINDPNQNWIEYDPIENEEELRDLLAGWVKTWNYLGQTAFGIGL